MANAMVALANITLGSSAATVTFASIPATYRDLRIVVTGVESEPGSQDVWLEVNGDTGANYSRVFMYGNGSTATSGSGTMNQFLPWFAGDVLSHATMDIMDYAQTDKHKTLLTRSNSGSSTGNGVSAQTQRWASTAAITSLRFKLANAFTFNAGSTFSLYGIVSA